MIKVVQMPFPTSDAYKAARERGELLRRLGDIGLEQLGEEDAKALVAQEDKP